MELAPQTIALLDTARRLAEVLPADAVLLITETDLDWNEVFEHLPADKLLVAAQDRNLTRQLQSYKDLVVLDIDPGPTPTQERMGLAFFEAVAQERLRSGAHIIALYNGIGAGAASDRPSRSIA